MSHGVKYTGREIEQSVKKTLVYMGISGATHETGGTGAIRSFKLGVRSSENLERDLEHSLVPPLSPVSLVALVQPVSPYKPS